MRLRGRNQAGPEGGSPIGDFWGWWAAVGRTTAEAGIGGGGFGRFTREMTVRVQATHPDLAWKLAPGRRAEHALIVTAAGGLRRGGRARRWTQDWTPAGGRSVSWLGD